MKRFGAQLNKKAQNIRLSMAERSLLRERVVSYMEYHPLPKDITKEVSVAEMVSDPYKAFNFSRFRLSGFIGALAMMVLVVVPVFAEHAMPGDVLYPVKVQFNEELRSTLSFSPYAKVEWETKRLERRLSEARLLADEGRLTEEIEAEVAQAVQAHSYAAQQGIATIRSSDSDEAALAEITFASALEVQSEVLASRKEQSGEAGRSVAALATVITEARKSVADSSSTANPPFEKLFARLESETTYAEELFTSVETEANREQLRDIERRFEDIKRKIDEAVTLHSVQASSTDVATSTVLTNTAEHEAKQILKAALIDTRKLISFMTDIDVRSSVTVDKLVPVTLTPEERRAALSLRIGNLTSAKAQIERLAVDASVEEKFIDGRDRFLKILEAADSAYGQDDHTRATELVAEAELMVSDLMLMGTVLPITPNSSVTSTDTEEGGEATASTTDADSREAETTSSAN